ncbi:MAG: quinolinate synthase NadA [Candidatus Thermoplasmatota archaeon]|nr:quinolinate synthase NadA [Candidatus Thermoplasmatota archaeon]
MEIKTISLKIEELKRKNNAILLVHNYQIPSIQDVADYLGDSLDLARRAASTDVENIVFCGVDFMAESAKILNPEKNVIIPDIDAKCPMAAMVDPNGLNKLKEKHPDAEVVSYINTTAEIKALSDICCTSANAVKVVKNLDSKQIIFVPDQNLGSYVKRFVTDKQIILWPGLCPTHHRIRKSQIINLKQKHPDAEVLVHPECRPEVIDVSDFVFSTNGMVNHAKESNASEFIIGTEKELCYRLKKENPEKEFYPVKSAICPNMKKITLEKVLNSLLTLEPKVILPDEIIKKAKKPLERMMNIGRGD